MAIIMQGTKQAHGQVTKGERDVEELLRRQLGPDCLIWYDIPVGRGKRRYPDFIVLIPQKGLLFLEVKDWRLDSFKHLDPQTITRKTSTGDKTEANPFMQVRQCMFAAINAMSGDKGLQQKNGPQLGKIKFAYATGVIFTKISRERMYKTVPLEQQGYLDTVLPSHLTLYQEDLSEELGAEILQAKLWDMFPYQFGEVLAETDIARIRGHLFPEIRIDLQAAQINLFEEPEKLVLQAASNTHNDDVNTYSVMKVMDVQQEQLARNLGLGHRVIHGVAGSGKTLILTYRCQYLAPLLNRPILVLCFNIVLAAKLSAVMASKGLADKVCVHHFHGWCSEQLKANGIKVVRNEAEEYHQTLAKTMVDAVEQGLVSCEQYGAVMIDEGHDFEAEWLKAVAKMVDVDDGHLLLLYDDAQSIYRKSGLDFSLSSVGIKAKGRTSILKLNYRNTREILKFSYDFAREYLQAQESNDEDHIPLVLPESGGVSGPEPRFYRVANELAEVAKAEHCIQVWQDKGFGLRHMAVLCVTNKQAEAVHERLNQRNIASQLLIGDAQAKKSYNPSDESVAIMTMKSSKGLEFTHVVLIGVGKMAAASNRETDDAKELYVGMTRAQQALVIVGVGMATDAIKGKGVFVSKLLTQTQNKAS